METIYKQEYIGNDKERGIKIEWNKVDKLYESLKCPKHVYHVDIPWDSANYFIIFSNRDTGKTTNVLLKALCVYTCYGVKTEWIRQKNEMIKEKDISTLFNTIIEYNYILKITNGLYSSVWYSRNERAFYLCNYDNNTKPTDIDTEPFIHFMSIENMYNIKSNYTSPKGDLIVLDEFQNKTVMENEFNDLFHIISTIKRHRESTKIIIMGNTISPYNYYFKEFDIAKVVLKMHPSERCLYTTRKGTVLYLEYLDKLTDSKDKYTEKRQILNNEYFGFDNLNSIVGGGWDIPNYPHITRELDKRKEVIDIFYLKYQFFYTELKLCYDSNYGYFIYVRPIQKNNMKTEYYIFTDEPPKSKNEIYGTGKEILACKKIWGLYSMNRFVYTTNDLGSLVEQFYTLYK